MLQSELFQKLFSDAPSADRETYLEHIADDYPYFTLAHYFLLKEKGGIEQSPFLASKTALHFSNPFLFQHRLKTDLIIPEMPEESSPEMPEAIHFEEEEQEAIPVTDSRKEVEQEEELEANQEAELEQVSELTDQQTEDSTPEEVILNPQSAEPALMLKNEGSGNGDTDLLFEPLHTTDYFASQGIKLSEASLAGDKLGRQMKSFTDWLKTMKRTPGMQEQIPVDQKVQAFADSSNREESVITESMAEVYVSQSKFERAREIYQKLSLLNPSKSAYFAAKLEQIKDK